MRQRIGWILLGGAAAAVCALSFSSHEATAQIGPPIPPVIAPCNGIPMEPVVMKETSGYGLAGPIHSRFTVFNNGVVSFSETAFGTTTGTAAFIVIPEADAKQLLKDLANAGAFGLCDQDLIVADLPPTTVTVFRGATDAKTHTFSYWVGFDEYAAVGKILNDFQQKWLASLGNDS